jgi:hypothetical protein
MTTIICPYCETELELPDSALPQETLWVDVKCPECNEPFLISHDGAVLSRAVPAKSLKPKRKFRHFLKENKLPLSILVLALSLLIHGCLEYNKDRYKITGSIIFDKNTGDTYNPDIIRPPKIIKYGE